MGNEVEDRPPLFPVPEGGGNSPGEAFGGSSPPRGRLFVVVAAAVSVLLIGALDYVTGPGISLLLFYLVPIGLAAWFAGLIPGVAISVFASLLLFLTGPLATGRADWEHLHYWNPSCDPVSSWSWPTLFPCRRRSAGSCGAKRSFPEATILPGR